jgi:hypothetical protein
MNTATRVTGMKVFGCPNGEVYNVDPSFHGEDQIILMPLMEHPAVVDGHLELDDEVEGGFMVTPVAAILKGVALMNPRVGHPYENYDSVDDVFGDEGYEVVNLHCSICGTKVEFDKCQEV